MPGGVGAGGEKPPATQLDAFICGQPAEAPASQSGEA